jgi:hypothetical protein
LITAVIALAGTAGIGACGDEYVRGAGVYTAPTTTTTTTTTAPAPAAGLPPVAPAQTTDAGGTEGSESPRLTATQERAVRGASRAARRFLSGYLPYSYGRRDARTIRSAAPSLRSALARQAPRVPPALAERARPRLERLQVSGIAAAGRVILLAHIDDGQSSYVALLTVRRRGDRWAVGQVR